MQFIRNHIAPADKGASKAIKEGLSVFALEEGFDKNHDRRLGFN